MVKLFKFNLTARFEGQFDVESWNKWVNSFDSSRLWIKMAVNA